MWYVFVEIFPPNPLRLGGFFSCPAVETWNPCRVGRVFSGHLKEAIESCDSQGRIFTFELRGGGQSSAFVFLKAN